MPDQTNLNIADQSAQRITVLGIGNVLWADEGFGVRCVEALGAHYIFNPEVTLVDGGTQGLLLIDHVSSCDALIILDAVDYGLTPGSLHVVENEEVPKFLGAKKMSLHQTGFQEVLQLAQLMGSYPTRVVLIGCQPEELQDYGGSLRPIVKAAVAQAVQLAMARLQSWGVDVQVRTHPVGEANAVLLPTLALASYENGRPSAELACRVGDERFLIPASASGA